MRLDKFISHAGSYTRTEAKKLIKDGKITVDGEVLRDGSVYINENADVVCISDNKLNYEKYVYLMMNKPGGVLSATEDGSGATVLDLLPKKYMKMGVFPVGRLDIDTTGLLILTNDGVTAHRLLSPKNRVYKTYEVIAEKPLTDADIKLFETGVDIGNYVCLPAFVRRGNPLNVSICEGKFHQVKRMFEAVDNRVTSLKRVEFAGIRLDDSLLPGQYRAVTQLELEKLTGR